jgi:hypothetical protein
VLAFDLIRALRPPTITDDNIDTIKAILLNEAFMNVIIRCIKKVSKAKATNNEKSSQKLKHSQAS